jgi:hypothetical protein
VIQQNYRRDYTGEFVLIKSILAGGAKLQEREWIPTAIENYHISGRAAVIGSRADQELFDFPRLARHRGGLLGKKRLQTYGSGDLWKDMIFDFFVATDQKQTDKIQKTGYSSRSTVYSTTSRCLSHPGHFYLLPYQPVLDELALAVYLAAFDEHREIFLLGYNNETPAGTRTWAENVNEVFETYNTTQFILVGVESNMPDRWRNNSNVSCMRYQKFISYCDV